jgi:hypothetical protein
MAGSAGLPDNESVRSDGCDRAAAPPWDFFFFFFENSPRDWTSRSLDRFPCCTWLEAFDLSTAGAASPANKATGATPIVNTPTVIMTHKCRVMATSFL